MGKSLTLLVLYRAVRRTHFEIRYKIMEPTIQLTPTMLRWHEAVENKNMAILAEILTEDCIFRSPFLWKPKHGRPLAVAILNAASHVFEDFAYHRQMTDGSSWTLEFSAHIGEIGLKGVDLIRINEAGKITEVEVLVRPFKGLQALAEAMSNQLVKQGDWEMFSKG